MIPHQAQFGQLQLFTKPKKIELSHVYFVGILGDKAITNLLVQGQCPNLGLYLSSCRSSEGILNGKL